MAASVSSWLAAATPTPTLASVASKCATTLSVGAVLSFGPGHPLTTLTHAAILETPCAAGQTPTSSSLPSVLLANAEGIDALDAETSGGSPQFSDFRDAFYESTFPVCYVLAATTVTAYMLVIMLFVTPRSFLDGGVAYLGRSGFTGSSPNGISIGGRPWLQKVAAMTVAISLTIATADTFRVAEEQYAWGVQNADQLQSEVMDSTELKIMRLISDTFLWLAQAQTLIRLFPRQREKVIIKWTAFALITLQVIFSALNSFYYLTSGSNGNARPQSFVDAVPALSYLFHLSLGLLYAAWVIYYALMKKRYAFYHPLMKNMPLISALSILSILIPVVFFVLDISRPEFIGWGEYVRWVGAAAASVVVWEWVERIEALEREEKKDGILGREVFDGDEMVEASASDFPWLRRRRNRKSQAGGGAGSSGAAGNGGGVGDSAGGDGGPREPRRLRDLWRGLVFTQGRDRPPAAVAPHTAAAAGEHRTRDQYASSGGRWDLRARLEDFAATQAEKVREKMQPTPETDSLPVTVIPAPPRQGAALARLLEEEGIDDRRSPLERSTSGGSGFSSFPGIGAGALPHALDRTTSDVSRQAPRGMSASVDTASVNANPSRPPLWPGVRTQPSYERAATTTTTTYEYEDASDVQTPTEHSRRETEGSRGPPAP
ncbi:pH-response regulator protein palH/RIM21 [Verticillium alfalfae VaMs.102]|uniref:pH-response regulator protein palH/RIM21 n=1 Tax=Verticillium alfalfae (strain VaMs.102 / ATCC MYA-4576 / FGSC 10136) TaxID=526221 RepID=C9SPZ5_VERA1|nr:pH-response regulator protein palH/RIM21 [Verticillium alfalfae VaMs.102]EEY20920.1 pH-response regulator protein palH/RIM21 [Verticillium alfalfae VaMs.102]